MACTARSIKLCARWAPSFATFCLTGAQFLPSLGRGLGSWKDRVCLIQMGLRLAHRLLSQIDHFYGLLCVLAFFLLLGGQGPPLRFSFTGAQFLPGLGRGFGSWKDHVCLIQMGLRLAPVGTSHSLTRALDHVLHDLLNALDGLEVVWLQ